MTLQHKVTWSSWVFLLFSHLLRISKAIGRKKWFPYIEEPHLSSLLTSIRADKLDKLFQRLLRVVTDSWVWEVRPRLLDDGWRWKVESRWRRMRTCCKRQNKTATIRVVEKKTCFPTAEPLSFLCSFLLLAQCTVLAHRTGCSILGSSDGFSPLRL